jgi:hypothetical protein
LFDDIVITNRDTVNVNGVIGKEELKQSGQYDFAEVNVNRDNNQLIITNTVNSGIVHYQLIDITGRNWLKGEYEIKTTIGTVQFPAGFYLLYLEKRNEGMMVKKILLN